MTKSDQAEKHQHNQQDSSEAGQSKWQKIQATSSEVAAEPIEPAETAAPTPSLAAPEIADLEQKLTEMEQKANEYWNDKMRLAAEIQNINRRHERDLSNRAKYATEQFAESLLPVVDSCVEGLKIEMNNTNAGAMHEGLELIYQQMLAVFKRFHIEEINPVDVPFDPKCHQAMLAQPSDLPNGTVLQVIQKGYQLHDRVLRPARVIVSKGPEA